jgi:hypothetical protein
VAGFTITITPNDGDTGAQTTIRVDTTKAGAVVTELTVRAPEGGGLGSNQLPVIDFAQLIAALTPPRQTAIAGTAAPRAHVTPAQAAAEAPAGRRNGTTGRAKAAGRKAPAQKATRARTRANKTTTRETANGRRAYRRMPDAAEVAAAYRQAGSASGVAEYFDVPRHTAAGWIRRLRGQGLIGGE